MNQERFAQGVLARKEKFYRIAYSYVKNEQDALKALNETRGSETGLYVASGKADEIPEK